MLVLIAETNPGLAAVWRRHLERAGAQVRLAPTRSDAVEVLCEEEVAVIVLDLALDGGALTVADFASYRRPDAQVVFVTSTTFFSDGSIFNLMPNACAYVEAQTPPDDIAAIVEHYGRPA